MMSPFPATQWSLILSIKKGSQTAEHMADITAFFELYRRPLLSYLQSMGLSPHDAEDLCQELFSNIYNGNKLAELEPEKGRMRSYLKMAAKRKMLNFFRQQKASKRGGGVDHLPIDDAHIAADDSPDRNFDRKWALTLVDLASEDLKKDYYQRERKAWFDALFPHLSGRMDQGVQTDIARKLDATESAVKSAAHRMKQKFQICLHNQVALTVDSESEIKTELLYLFDSLA